MNISNKDLFDRLAREYDSTRGVPPDRALEQIADGILDISTPTRDTTFLEPGVGTGRVAVPLARRGFFYTGVDVSWNMMEELRRKLGKTGTRFSMVQADAAALPFRDASFDVVLTAQLLYLIEDWRQALAEVRRVLRPGGLYLFCYEETERNRAARLLDEQWGRLLAGYDFEPFWHSSVTNQEVFDTLREQHADLEDVVAAEWLHNVPVRQYLDAYSSIVRPLYPALSDGEFEEAIRNFRTWAEEHLIRDEAVVSSRTKFMVKVVRNWGGTPP
ncbi:MAG TPA: class I SAM-dependent methyltransferase [Chloroflexia bacterium]